MKVVRVVVVALVAAIAFASCSSLARGAVSGALGAITGGDVSDSPSVSSSTTAAAAPAVADFQSGEILCSTDNGEKIDASYYAARVLTPASAATKNQAEVVFIADGKKSWVNFVINSRKATKADFAVGATVFFLSGWQGYDDISADDYRKDQWRLGNITSTDELFKNRVEIGGDSFAIAFLRVPTDPIQ